MDITNIPDEIKPIAVVILIIISFLPLLKFFKDSYIDFEMSKFKQIINTKGYEDGLSDQMKASLMDTRDRAVFKKIYGLNLSKKYRDIALKIECQPDTNIDCEDLKRAAHHLEFKDSNIVVNYKPWLIFNRKVVNVSGFLYFLLGILMILVPITVVLINYFGLPLSKKVEVSDLIFWIFMGCLYLGIAYDQLRQREALKAVIKIIVQSEKLPNLISINNNWKGKNFLKKLGLEFKSPDEIDFEQ
ncbi:hypothetical protein JCM18903_2968 [Psychrobacter sp. JCM 18903]|uniref:hypothetical protein n=1 Tax=unclassified Psychrobacter TaxID=196806 RepID=UPI0004338A89|nr:MULTISPECIES: hypothetical protein [unclassified Psychrobacter]GAF62860.1 hypothetical protein JCM18903_2968 [Psychrobacter sp. JCM 18903]